MEISKGGGRLYFRCSREKKNEGSKMQNKQAKGRTNNKNALVLVHLPLPILAVIMQLTL